MILVSLQAEGQTHSTIVFSLDQPSSDDNDDIVILSLSLHLTLKTKHRYTQVSSGARLLRA